MKVDIDGGCWAEGGFTVMMWREPGFGHQNPSTTEEIVAIPNRDVFVSPARMVERMTGMLGMVPDISTQQVELLELAIEKFQQAH